MKFRVAFLGILTAEEFYAGISKEEDLEALFDAAIKELFRFCKKERIAAIIFNNLSADNSRISGLLEAKKFIKMEALPSTLIEIKARSLEEYISGLSKNMRKDLERKLKRSASLARLTTEVREDIDDISMDIHKLYLNNFGESQVHFEVLTEEFFRNIPKYMPGEAKYFVTYDKDRIVAFNLCLFKGSTCIDKFIGFDREVARKYHLYFTTFCHNIDWCIKNNIRFYCPGPTDYRPKVRLGARLVPLADYSKSHNPAYNFFLRLSAKFIKPENIDSSFGDIREPEY
jgi:predicted N-acyltransferase